MKYKLLTIAIVQLSLTLASLQGQAPANAPSMSSGAAAASADPSQPQLEQRHPRYKIQCEDVMLLTFPLSPELNQTVTVQPDGYINLQNVGSLYVKNLTIPEVVESLKGTFSGVLHNPIIDVDLQDFQKPFFIATGQVGKPGQYDLRADITVAEAIAIAGGLNNGAKSNVYLFHRTSTDWYKVRKIDVNHILHGKDLNEDSMIQPGDMIYVPQKAIERFREYVPYSVNLGTYLTPGGNL